jgi:hypothetical protein
VVLLGAILLEQIDAMVRVGLACQGRDGRHAALRSAIAALYLERLRAHGCTMEESKALELLEMDLELNAQGLAVWLDRAR